MRDQAGCISCCDRTRKTKKAARRPQGISTIPLPDRSAIYYIINYCSKISDLHVQWLSRVFGHQMRPWSWPISDVRLSIIWLSRSKQIKTACSLRPALATHDMRAIRKECSWFHMWSMHASSWIRIQDWTFIILVFEKRTQLYKQKKILACQASMEYTYIAIHQLKQRNLRSSISNRRILI